MHDLGPHPAGLPVVRHVGAGTGPARCPRPPAAARRPARRWWRSRAAPAMCSSVCRQRVPTAYSRWLNRTANCDGEDGRGDLERAVRVVGQLGQQQRPPAEPADDPVHHLAPATRATAAAASAATIVQRYGCTGCVSLTGRASGSGQKPKDARLSRYRPGQTLRYRAWMKQYDGRRRRCPARRGPAGTGRTDWSRRVRSAASRPRALSGSYFTAAATTSTPVMPKATPLADVAGHAEPAGELAGRRGSSRSVCRLLQELLLHAVDDQADADRGDAPARPGRPATGRRSEVISCSVIACCLSALLTSWRR